MLKSAMILLNSLNHVNYCLAENSPLELQIQVKNFFSWHDKNFTSIIVFFVDKEKIDKKNAFGEKI